MPDYRITGKIVDTKEGRGILFDSRKTYLRILDSFDKDDKVTVSIGKYSYKRSTQQNRYYHLYLGVIANETGELEDDLHEFFKRKLLPPRFMKVLGEDIRVPTSTTTLNKSEFAEYIMKIHALTEVPPPDIELAGFIPNDKPYY